MSCSIQSQNQSLLHCIWPKPVGEMESLYVYFKFDAGHEKALVMCTKENEFECRNEDGFTCKQTHPWHAEITIPESFAPESGYFRCVMPGVTPRDVTRCQWPPSDIGRPDDLGNLYSTFAPSLIVEAPKGRHVYRNIFRLRTSILGGSMRSWICSSPLVKETLHTPQEETPTEASAGVIIGPLISAVLVLVAIILIWVLVRRKCTKRSGSLKTCPLEECICNAEDHRKRLCWRLESTQKECEAERGNLRSDRTTESNRSESPLLPSDLGNSKTSTDSIPDIEGDKANRCPSVQFTENDTWEREKNNKIS